MMRRWLIAACCSAILLAGCSEQTASGVQDDTQQTEKLGGESDRLAESAARNPSDSEAESPDQDDAQLLSVVTGPPLSSTVQLQQAGGLYAEAKGRLILNEPGGYYLYILPGYRATIDEGTLILSGADHDAQAVIETLPPQIDIQLAAAELRETLQQLDEQMIQITEYMRLEEWADATIYRAYQEELRITAIIKRVHGIPLRITITEPVDVQKLSSFMAMLSTINVEQIEMLRMADEQLASKYISEAFSLQSDVLAEFRSDADRLEPSDSSDSDDGEAEENEEPMLPALSLRELVGSKEDIIAFLETVYTSEAAEQVADELKLGMRYGELRADLSGDGFAQLWNQAALTLVSQAAEKMRVLARVPLETEGAFRLQEIELRKSQIGWRLHTPLAMQAELPAIPDEVE